MMVQSNVRILIVDDEEAVRSMLVAIMEQQGYNIVTADDGIQAINLLQKNTFDIVLLDIHMPRVDGIEVLKYVKANAHDSEDIMFTSVDDIKIAVDCIKLGAYDFLVKSTSSGELFATVARAYEHKRLLRDNLVMHSKIAQLAGNSEIIGNSHALQKTLNLALRVAPSDSTVLIQGDSGTGKELLANYIYRNSPRHEMPFIALNCASITDTLVESELFGHEKGAFTDARAAKPGLLQIADGGTVFLDEIGDISHSIQPKLLRFLQEGEFRRVGGTAVLRSNVRIISATNKDLMKEVIEGRFREDLFYRLNVITLNIPPLAERKEDIPLLADWFCKHKVRSNVKKTINPKAMELLLQYDWPGNVRELENVIERASILSDSSVIEPHDISFPLKASLWSGVVKHESNQGTLASMEEVEHHHIKQVLTILNGNKIEAAKVLGISVKTLYTKIQKYRISEEM